MNTFSQVWVFSDTPSRLPELMNGAQALANQINTFVLNDADGAQAIQLGANHVWTLNGKPDDRMIEAANYWRQNWVIALKRRCLTMPAPSAYRTVKRQ